MKDKTTDYLIIGNSAAGLSAAASIRKNDGNGTISIISSEEYTNYSKPLITYYLAGKVSLEKIYLKDKTNWLEILVPKAFKAAQALPASFPKRLIILILRVFLLLLLLMMP